MNPTDLRQGRCHIQFYTDVKRMWGIDLSLYNSMQMHKGLRLHAILKDHKLSLSTGGFL